MLSHTQALHPEVATSMGPATLEVHVQLVLCCLRSIQQGTVLCLVHSTSSVHPSGRLWSVRIPPFPTLNILTEGPQADGFGSRFSEHLFILFMTHSFIHLFNKCLTEVQIYVGIVPGIRDRTLNSAIQHLILKELTAR